MFKYLLFGFKVNSFIKFAFEEDSFVHEDIRIHEWKCSEKDLTTTEGNIDLMIDKDRATIIYHLKYKFNVINGRLIEVFKVNDSLDTEINQILLGTIFTVLMHQRNMFPLHGSGVIKDNAAIVLLGESGAGKSSLAASFVSRNYTLLTDDVIKYMVDDNHINVSSSYPTQKLCRDSFEEIGIALNEDKKVFDIEDKYYTDVKNEFHHGFYPLKLIIELVPSINDEVEIVEIVGIKKIELLIANTFRHFLITSKEKKASHFNDIGKLANQVKIFRLKRPHERFTLDEQVLIIESIMIGD